MLRSRPKSRLGRDCECGCDPPSNFKRSGAGRARAAECAKLPRATIDGSVALRMSPLARSAKPPWTGPRDDSKATRLPGQVQTTITLRKVSIGTELTRVQEGAPS